MNCWPRSAYFSLLVILMAWGFSLYLVHHTTANSYRAVGINDGKILQSTQIMEAIKKVAPVPACNPTENMTPRSELITVKTNSLFLVNENGLIRFFAKANKRGHITR